MGWGNSSERCLKWGGGGWGSLRDLSKNILKQGVGKGKSCLWGEGVLKVSLPLLPRKILIVHIHTKDFFYKNYVLTEKVVDFFFATGGGGGRDKGTILMCG